MNISNEDTTSMDQSDCETTSGRRSIHHEGRLLDARWGLHTTEATRSGEKTSWGVYGLQISENVKKLEEAERKESTNDSHKKRFRKKRRTITMTKKHNEFEHMQINISINEKRSQTMINSNASKNFLATKYAKYRNLSIRRKNVVYSLTSMNELTVNDEWVKNEITIHLSIQKYHENVTFNVIELINYDIIFDISWLRRNNSQIDWKKKSWISKINKSFISYIFWIIRMRMRRNILKYEKKFVDKYDELHEAIRIRLIIFE